MMPIGRGWNLWALNVDHTVFSKRNVSLCRKGNIEIWAIMLIAFMLGWLNSPCLFTTVNINLLFLFLLPVQLISLNPLYIPYLLFPTYQTLWRLQHLGHVFRWKFSSFILLELCGETKINTGKSKPQREEKYIETDVKK